MRALLTTALSLAFCVAALGCTPATPPAAPAPEPIDVGALRTTAQAQGSVRIIARVRTDVALPAGADARATALADLTEGGVVNAASLSESLPLIVAEVTPAQLDEIAASGQYAEIMADELAFPSLAQSGPLIGAPELWTLGGRGAGQAVAILDTGVEAAHPFLAGRVTAEACFSSRSPSSGAEPTCPNGQSSQVGAGAARPCQGAAGCEHGTHVAGIAAGRSARFSGVAPDAEIIAVQVFSQFRDRPGNAPCAGSGQASPCIASFTSDQIRALDHVRQIAAQRPVAAVNMSLGGGRSATACDADMTKGVIDQLRAAGVATVIASGNDGFPDSVSRPGCISTAVTVGATSKQNQVAPFSNRGPVVDVLAPGVNINSSVLSGRFAAFSGTSMAAPHVAGAFAAIRSYRPRASVDDIERALVSTGVGVQGRPRIAVAAAARALPAPAPEGNVAQTSGSAGDPALQAVVAEISALPADRPVRIIVRARTPANATPAQVAAAVEAASTAARAAGAQEVAAIPGQALFTAEATPAQAAAIAASGAVSGMQRDGTATPQ